MPADSFYTYLPDGVSFTSKQAAAIKTIYAPLCGTDALSVKSAITPFLSGDIKIDKFHYLTKPASREDLRSPLREFSPGSSSSYLFRVRDLTRPSRISSDRDQTLRQRRPVRSPLASLVTFGPRTSQLALWPRSRRNPGRVAWYADHDEGFMRWALAGRTVVSPFPFHVAGLQKMSDSTPSRTTRQMLLLVAAGSDSTIRKLFFSTGKRWIESASQP